jgi:hypothetical protein
LGANQTLNEKENPHPLSSPTQAINNLLKPKEASEAF